MGSAALGPLATPSATAAAVAAAVAGPFASKAGLSRLRAVAIGDSTTAGGLKDYAGVTVDVANAYSFPSKIIGYEKAGAQSWFTHACLASGGRLLNVHNAGVSSDTTVGMLARFQTDVVAYAPQVVFIGDAHNDFSLGIITTAQTRANVAAMVAAAQAAGIVPVLRMIYPENNASYAGLIRQHNAWLRSFASDNGLFIVDTYAAVVDNTSTTGAWQSALTIDAGTHPNTAGAAAAGARVVADLAGLLRGNGSQWGPWAPTDRVGGGVNLLLNPLMQDDVNVDGKADNWACNGTPTTVVDGSVLGKAQQVVVSAGAGNIHQDISVNGTTVRVGDRLKWAGLVKTVANAGSLNWYMNLSFPVGSPTAPDVSYPMQPVVGLDLGWSYFECEVIIPAGATTARVGLYWTAGTGTVSLAQQGLYNMTTL